MLATRLQEQFGIPPQALKTRALRRSIFSYRGPKKKQFLAMKISMIVNRVLPDDGQRRSYRRDLTHDYLAAAAGLESRATFTHWQTFFRNPVDEKTSLLWSKRRFGEPNLYNTLIPEKKGTEWIVTRIATGKVVPRGRYMSEARARDHCRELNQKAGKTDYQVRGRVLPEDSFFYADVEQIMEDPRFADLFSIELAEELHLNGFKKIPEWVWHPVLGISSTARLVLTYYICCGILDAGWVQVHQPKVCKALGMCVKTLYNAERELEKVGLIRVVGQRRGKKPEHKPWLDLDPEWRTINKILFLPIRSMTDEEIRAERLRRLAARKALHQARKDVRQRMRSMRLEQEHEAAWAQRRLSLAVQVCRSSRLHNELVEACKGQTSRINAIWDAARIKLLDAGVHQKLIMALIPQVLAPPGHAGAPIRPDSYHQEREIRATIEKSFKNATGRMQ